MTNPAIAAIAAKYGDLLAETKRLKIELRAAGYALEHVKVTLPLFDPQYPIDGIKPHRTHASQKPQTDRNRMAMEILRESSVPMTSRDLARQALTYEGNEQPTPRILDHAAARIHNFLKRQEKRGATHIVSREPIRWRLI